MNGEVLRRLAAVAAITCLVLPRIDAQNPTQAPKPTPAPAASPPKDIDGGWPRDYTTPAGAAMRVFQPQVASWDGQRRMVAFAAVSYTAKGAAKPALGTIKL